MAAVPNELMVHRERLTRGTTNHRQAHDLYPIVAPTARLMPWLRARLQQRHRGVGFRIDTLRLEPCIAVTPGTRQA